jgi:ABC-type enterochelin transport system permease subunit
VSAFFQKKKGFQQKPLGTYRKNLTSFIQTLLSPPEFHTVRALRLAGFTADWEFHPTLKFFVGYIIAVFSYYVNTNAL